MLDLVMAIHCHQPIGNFDDVFERAFQRCYRPLLELLEAHPSVKVALHFSGPLLEWLEEYEPDSLDFLGGLVQCGQVELLSGGFFEPLLTSIPVQDARGQIEMMNKYLAKWFGYKPTGLWLTERVWDPNLPLILSGTGMEYTVVDDTHFFYSGLKPDEIYGRYITEKEGQTLSLLATPMIMRYLIPFKPVDEAIAHLRWLEQAGRGVAVYSDDGEKFGLWPGTYEWVIQKGWLDRFFTAIADSSAWLRTVLPGDFVASRPPLGRIYLPQSSYEEMTEWALPPEQAQAFEDIVESLRRNGRWEEWRPFIRGGVWDNFLVKYDEANRMHKKMLFLSQKIGQNPEAREFLWRGQCNCAYWHGIFGGLYLGHLRRAVYENLIRAQAGLEAKSGEGFSLIQIDLDKDGAEEILIVSPTLCLGLEPSRGGGLFEISHLPLAINLSDTLTRRHEPYHRLLNELPKSNGESTEDASSIHERAHNRPEDIESLPVIDAYTKASLLDHFLDPHTTPEDYASNNYSELSDFVQGQYQVEQALVSSSEAQVELSRTGQVGPSTLIVNKIVRIGKDSRITVNYRFECLGPDPISTLYGCEFNLTLFSDKDQERYYSVAGSGRRREVFETGREDNLTRFELVNGPDRLTAAFAFSSPVSVWFFPLMTVSKSEEGFDLTYQGSSLLFLHAMDLSKGQKEHIKIDLELIAL